MDVHAMPPARRVEAYRGAIAHMEQAAASRDALAAQAAEIQRGAAFLAAWGDPEARRIVTEAAAAEAQARAEARTQRMGAEAARRGLAAAEAEVEAERVADLERRAVGTARARVEAARKVDDALAALAEAHAEWEAAGQGVAALMGEPGGDRVLAGIDFGAGRNILPEAVPYPLRDALRMPFATGERRPKVAEVDPVAGWLAARQAAQAARGEPVGGTSPAPAGPDPNSWPARAAKLSADVEAQEAKVRELDAGGPGSREKAADRLRRRLGGVPTEAMVEAELERAARLRPVVYSRLMGGMTSPGQPSEAYVLAELERELEGTLVPTRTAGQGVAA